MAHVEGTFGAMLQGVSQQPDRIRTAGQVTAQDNYDSNVAAGLTSRPGSLELSALVGANNETKFTDLDFKGRRYIVGYRSGTLNMWQVSGTKITPVAITGSSSYVGSDMIFTVDPANNRILCLNRDTSTTFSTTVAGRPFHAGVVTCLGGQFSRRYRVTVSVGSASVSVSYATPSGAAASDAADTSSEAIIRNLVSRFRSVSLPTGLRGMTVNWITGNSSLRVNFTAPLTITVDDGDNGETLRFITDTAESVTSLPKTAQHGHIVLIRGGRSEDDDFYLRFISDVTTVDGAGFGSPGVWREAASPDIANDWTATTMPHSLTLNDAGTTGTFAASSWIPRRAGDENTNPTPDFVGSPIRDMIISEERLVFVSNGGFFTSRSGSPLDLWNQSATVKSSSDPIGIRSNSSTGSTLDWIIPFDRNLLLVSDPGKAQFVVSGNLNPDSSSMVLTTEYDIDSGVRPVSTGRTIVMPYRIGNFVGINEFSTNDVVSTNTADPITAVQTEYISGRTNTLRSAENFNRFAITADGDDKSIWIYRYLWSGTERLQSAWYRYVFSDPVKFFFFDNTYMYVVTNPEGSSESFVSRLDLNRTKDDVGFHITLDRMHTETVKNNKVTVPYKNALVVQRAGCSAPGLLALSTSTANTNGTVTYTLNSSQCPNNSTVTLGQAVERSITPTQAFSRDRNGAVMSNIKMYIRNYLVHLTDSGSIIAKIVNPYRPTYETMDNRFPLDDEPLDANRSGVLTSQVVRVPVRELTTRHTLSVTSTDIRPTTIVEIEFEADLRNARRRV